MSLEAASANLPGVPEELVVRSASARAAAQGVSLDDVLASWGGGAPVAAAAPAPAQEAAPAAAAAAPAAVSAPAAAPAPVLPAGPTREVIYVLPGSEDPVEAVPIGDRIRTGILMGSALGAVAGIVSALATLAIAGGGMVVVDESPGVAIDPTTALIVAGLAFAFFGLVIGRVSAALPARFDPARAVDFRGGVIGALGFVLGGAVGVATAGIVAGGGTELLGQEPLVGVPAVGSFFTITLMSIVMGAVVGTLALVITLPTGLDDESHEASGAVQKRLVTGYMVPIVVLISMAAIIVAVGSLFLQFPAISPLIAVFIAGAILTFGFLATARPNAAIGGRDVAIFVSGIAIIVVFIAAVAFQIGGGHGEEGDDHGGEDDHSAAWVWVA